MIINRIILENFRNYGNCNLCLNPNINVLYGKNAQGKTNILESIYLCSMGKSHRTSKNSELIKHNESFFKCKIEVTDGEYNKDIEYNFRNNKKELLINEIKVDKLGNFVGELKTVLFAPEHLDIIKDGPSYRRKFVDMCICQTDKKYFYKLQEYNKILKQKAALLKNSNHRDFSLIEAELEIWNEQLVEAMLFIYYARKTFVNEFKELLVTRNINLTNSDDVLKFRYLSKLNDVYDNDVEIFRKNLSEKVRSLKQREINAGIILYGIHRDEYEILLNEKEIKVYGSQGQVRTSVIALKLAEMDYIKVKSGSEPILLLDDVFSELDEYRQQYLIDTIKDRQVIITCTSRDIISLDKYQCEFINVNEGKISQI